MKRYRETLPMTRALAERAFDSGDPERICDAMVRTAFHDPDPRWVQGHLRRFARHGSAQVRGLAAVCFGHLARMHGRLDKASARRTLKTLLKDPVVAGRARDALEDIERYAPE